MHTTLHVHAYALHNSQTGHIILRLCHWLLLQLLVETKLAAESPSQGHDESYIEGEKGRQEILCNEEDQV